MNKPIEEMTDEEFIESIDIEPLNGHAFIPFVQVTREEAESIYPRDDNASR